jgi:hypothetical protein
MHVSSAWPHIVLDISLHISVVVIVVSNNIWIQRS